MLRVSPAPGSRNGAKNQTPVGEDGTSAARTVVPPCHCSPKKASEGAESLTATHVGSNPALKAGRSVKS